MHSDGILLLARPADPAAHVADLRIFNPDGSEAELSGNGVREAVLYLRAAGLDRPRRLHDPDRGRRGHADADRARLGPGRDGAGRDDVGRLSRAGPDDGVGTIDVGGVEREFQHVSIGNPQCAIEVADGPRGPRPAGDRPGDRGRRRSSRTAPTSASGRPRARGCGRGSSSAGWGRPCRRAPVPPAPPSPPTCAGPPSPITVVLDGGELEVEIGDDLDDRSDRDRGAGLRRRASSDGFVDRLASALRP